MDLRKVKLKGGAFAQLGLDLDEAGALPDNPKACGQAQAGAFTRRFGGEERLEEMGFNLRAHPCPSVRDSQEDIITWIQIGEMSSAGVVEGETGGSDHELTTIGHGIARVDRKIHDHLLDLTRVRFDEARIGV